MVRRHSVVRTSHSLAVPSEDTVSTFVPSLMYTAQFTYELCPLRDD